MYNYCKPLKMVTPKSSSLPEINIQKMLPLINL